MTTGLASQIEQVNQIFRENHLAVGIRRVALTHRLIRYHLVLEPPCSMKEIAALTHHIAATLGIPFCRVYREEGQVQLEMPRQPPKVHLLPLCRSLAREQGQCRLPPATAVMGMDLEGEALLLQLSNRLPGHVLIGGAPGAGKTSLAHTIVTSLVIYNRPRALQVGLVTLDGPQIFDGLPHLLAPTVTQPGHLTSLLELLVGEMKRRLENHCTEPRLLLVVDDLADILSAAGQLATGALKDLLQGGQPAGIHIVACTREPAADSLACVLDHFMVHIVGITDSPENLAAAGVPGNVGATRHLVYPGDFLIVADEEIRQMRAAYISEDDLAHLMRGLQSGNRVESCRPHCGEAPVPTATRRDSGSTRLPRLFRSSKGAPR